VSDNLVKRTLPRPPQPTAPLKRYWHLLLALVIAVSAFSYWWAFYAFYDVGYAPLQPVPYSHKLHAGDLGIDCKYCHFNAERGKHAGVPPVSVCMGCHAPEKGMAAQSFPGVVKLLELANNEAGFYDNDQDLDPAGEGVRKDGGVIHWNRVHKLPDHVFFSHQWHVKAGVSCQTCHGPIETMEVVQQAENLSMGWCISCHRNDNYVGGREYDGSAETFTVGTANYDVLRQRIRPDNVVHFHEPLTASVTGHHEEVPADVSPAEEAVEEHHGQTLRGLERESRDEDLVNRTYFTQAQFEKLNELFQHYRQDDGTSRLPRWRIADLPETHALFYLDHADADGDGKVDDPALLKDPAAFGTFQNAPTQCSTCHQ
jgi:hypothetical protein